MSTSYATMFSITAVICVTSYIFRRQISSFLSSLPRLRVTLDAPKLSAQEQAKVAQKTYETDTMTGLYAEFHFGPIAFRAPDDSRRNFPQRCAELAVAAYRDANSNAFPRRIADVGCGTGRSSFEFAKLCRDAQVLGLDYSATFIQVAKNLQTLGSLTYTIPRQGDIPQRRIVTAEELKITAESLKRITFEQADAHNIRKSESKDGDTFDLVLAANLIDRLYDPALFLRNILPRISPSGVLVLTSPYTWLPEYTAKDKWLGARSIDGKDVTTELALTEFFGEAGWEQIDAQDVPFYIRETERKGQYTVAHLTAWRRKSQ